MDKNAFLEYQLLYKKARLKVPSLFTRVDNLAIPDDLNEIRLFAIARNEALRLPYFLQYYFDKKVDRVFIIDNDSEDCTVDIALSYNKVHVFSTKHEYKHHWYWMEYFLEAYGNGHWCLVVDIDELLSYPHAELVSIRELCKFLSINNATALRSLLLDIYSDKPIDLVCYSQGENPLNVCPFFDPLYRKKNANLLNRLKWRFFEAEVFLGGMRERIFGEHLPYYLSKISLFKNNYGIYLTQGMHAIDGAVLANLQGVVFHTKFLNDFVQEVKTESLREQHYNNAVLYKVFNEHISHTPNISFIGTESRRFENSTQLLDLNIMKSSEQFDEFAKTKKISWI